MISIICDMKIEWNQPCSTRSSGVNNTRESGATGLTSEDMGVIYIGEVVM